MIVACLFCNFFETSFASNRYSTRLEPEYIEKSKALKKDDIKGRLALAGWCFDQGFIREMLSETDKVLKIEPQNKEALKLLYLEKTKDQTSCVYPKLSSDAAMLYGSIKPRTPDKTLPAKLRSKSFKRAAKTNRFHFFSDLDKDRVQEYVSLMNRYYDQTRGIFRILKTEHSIRVGIFAKRSDYLQYFQRKNGRSGENIAGFFTYDRGGSLLCFYDKPDDNESVFNTAKHECTHLLVKHCMQGAEMALWLNEGFACYYGSNGLDWSGSYPANCYLTVTHRRNVNKTLTLNDLMDTPNELFDFDCYATAWSWICYLRSNPNTKDKLANFFIALREQARSPSTKEWSSEEWAEESNALFDSKIGGIDRLQKGWESYIENDLKPETADQLFNCANEALYHVLGWNEMTPPLTVSQKMSLLNKSAKWRHMAAEAGVSKIKSLAQLHEPLALLARSKCLYYQPREGAYAAAKAERLLDAFISDPKNATVANYAGNTVLRILRVLWEASDQHKDDDEGALDFVSDLKEKADQYKKDLQNSSIAKYKKFGILKKLSLIELQIGVVENLIVDAKTAFRIALSKDATSRNAAFGWLNFALEFAIDELDHVFPYIQYQVELDPDNIGLAYLSAAYKAMGNEAYAGSLMKKAELNSR